MNLEKTLARQFPALEHTLTAKDCMLYALGVGVGARPQAEGDLQYVYEEGLKVFPAMVNVIAHPGAWVKDSELDIDWLKILHGEQAFEILEPLSPTATYVGSYRVADVVDKGAGKGALLFLDKTLSDSATRRVVSHVRSTYVLRGDGGSGGTTVSTPTPQPIPDRPADQEVTKATLPQAGLIYRLSGDYNPIHASPAIARKAGFERPILHGLGTLGIVTGAILEACCEQSPDRLRSLQVRFSAPVYPGETLRTEIWDTSDGLSFRTTATERGTIVINNGLATLT